MSSHLPVTPWKGFSPSVPHRRGFNPWGSSLSSRIPHPNFPTQTLLPAVPRLCSWWHNAQHHRTFSLKESERESKQSQLCCRDSSCWEQSFPQLPRGETCLGQGLHLGKQKPHWGAPKSGCRAVPGRPGSPQCFYSNDNSMPAIKS